MKTMLVAVAALSTVGCVPTVLTTTSESFHTLAQGSYQTAAKRQVWGRALEQFQRHNAIVTVADYEAGILASGGQPAGVIPCNAYRRRCGLTVGWQFTMSDDGTSLLSVRRAITGDVEYLAGSLLQDDRREMLDYEADTILAAIVGERGSVAQRKPRTAPPPPSLLPVGARCYVGSECASGQCVLAKCSK
ncbi:hypothetical protein [Anaeromyxobacter terrae]|uniref:hypothetical protein n=1 Tax=Anaeromyxobacter terrae TaxID=2925406 RepID=UPI001F5A5852|nr:hypothetical protein [Anaeromyxobacter sp. SG22]